ncbi:MAG TPA: peptidoglycan DD-metalloendopeptidase family protein [Polyangia bacterium]|nr:peptidoglycan DD-metalloendopeptidase family protein [Polyangia bacterium]
MRELAASPRCVTLRLLLARALLARHQRKDAAAQLRECLAVDPSCLAAQSALADIAEQERLAAAAAAGQPIAASSGVRSFSALPSSSAIAERAKPMPSAVVVSDVPMVPKTPERTSPNSSAAALRATAHQEDQAPLLVPAQSRLSARISVPQLVSPPAQSYPPTPLYEAEEMRTVVSAPPPQMRPPSVERPISGLFSTGTPTSPFVPPSHAPLIAAPEPVRLSALYSGGQAPLGASLYAGDQAPTNVAKSNATKTKPRLEPRWDATAEPQKLPPLKPQIVRNRRRTAFARDAISTPTASVSPVDGRFLARGSASADDAPFSSRRRPIPGAAWLLVGLVASIPLWNRDRGSTALPPAAMLSAAVAPAHPQSAPPPPDAAALEKAQLAELMRDIWVHPLPGPARRMPIRDSRVFGAERAGDRPSECVNGHCGVDIGSAYGEAVFAVHDGVIDRVQRGANPDHGGHYVRIAHRGRTIISQYFHLAAIPPALDVGQTVKAGDIIGWVGRSGIKHSAPHLHFTIAVQDPNGDHSRYIDPEPLIALWPLRVSAPGGDPLRLTAEVPAGTPRGGAHHHHHAAVATSAPATTTASAATDEE